MRFAFRLAMGLGKTFSEIENMGQWEFERWVELYHLEPWGSRTDDERQARICQSLGGGTIRDWLPLRGPLPKIEMSIETKRLAAQKGLNGSS